jgi:hypothetical protein
MRFALFLIIFAIASAQTSITFDPALVTHCTSTGLGSGNISWNYSGATNVQIRIGAVDGTPLTQLVGSQGTLTVNDRVTDGMVFLLTDPPSRQRRRTFRCR